MKLNDESPSLERMKIPNLKGSFLVWTITDSGMKIGSKMYKNMKIAIQRGCYDSNRGIPSDFEIDQINENSYFVPHNKAYSRYDLKCHGWVIQKMEPPKDEELARFIEVVKTMSV